MKQFNFLYKQYVKHVADGINLSLFLIPILTAKLNYLFFG